MDDHEESVSNHGKSSKLRWVTQRKKVLMRRKRKLQTVRLGGKKRHHRGLFLLRLVKRIRLRWLKLKYSLLLKKLKTFYHSLVKELLEGGATFEAAQKRIFMESSLAVPVLGLHPLFT